MTKNMIVDIDHYAKLINQNAEMYAVLKVCKDYFEEMELTEDSVTYKMICNAINPQQREKVAGDE